MDTSKKTTAHVAPLFIFMGFLMLPDLLGKLGFVYENDTVAPWWRYDVLQWVYPLQTIVGLFVVIRWWKHYDFCPCSPRVVLIGAVMGVVGIVLWVSPTWIFNHYGMEESWLKHLGFQAREDGFDPTLFAEGGAYENRMLYIGALAFRLFRMTVVVALVEEIFWRGFLMRFLLDRDGNFWKQPFGKFSWLSLSVVTVAFMLVHAPVDYFGAVLYGLLTYGVALWTKSLCACVVMHAVANFALGIYVLNTQQWGYW